MACTTACVAAVAAPKAAARRSAAASLRAAPLRARAGRRSVSIYAANVQYEYATKVFERELVK